MQSLFSLICLLRFFILCEINAYGTLAIPDHPPHHPRTPTFLKYTLTFVLIALF